MISMTLKELFKNYVFTVDDSPYITKCSMHDWYVEGEFSDDDGLMYEYCLDLETSDLVDDTILRVIDSTTGKWATVKFYAMKVMDLTSIELPKPVEEE
jgi:hypothetical protein